MMTLHFFVVRLDGGAVGVWQAIKISIYFLTAYLLISIIQMDTQSL